jgi:hypothetical protein
MIEQGFCSAEFLEGLGSQQRKNERSPLVHAFQHPSRSIGVAAAGLKLDLVH